MTAMSLAPMHKLEIVHGWEEVSRIWSGTWMTKTVERCQYCDVERKLLHLRGNTGTSLKESLETATPATLQRISDQWQRIARSINGRFDKLVVESNYNTIDDIIIDFNKRGYGLLEGSELPYGQWHLWINRPERFRIKYLLGLVQGPACNRCDAIFSRRVELTIDHIIPDKSRSQPCNLQLLCRDCNEEKGNNPPDERDISPFTYEGPSCEHRLTCVEFHAIQAYGEDNGLSTSPGPSR